MKVGVRYDLDSGPYMVSVGSELEPDGRFVIEVPDDLWYEYEKMRNEAYRLKRQIMEQLR